MRFIVPLAAIALVFSGGAALSQDVRGVIENLNRALNPEAQQNRQDRLSDDEREQIRRDEERYWRDYYGGREDWRERRDREFSRDRDRDRDADRGRDVARNRGVDPDVSREAILRQEYDRLSNEDKRRYDRASSEERRRWDRELLEDARRRYERMSDRERRLYEEDLVDLERRTAAGSSERRDGERTRR